ncbi:excalibur calcium-binding domain-containing protein [Streptomyces sp. NPDC056452]|uniref:excalibur calcium-binding domain-containing protein n=1 Tax=Streptomyces sp. NPDC056452 TaxID=3345821 RepID=UPI003677F43E
MTSRVKSGPVRISAGIAVLAMALAGCGGSGSDAKTVADSPRTASGERALALVDDEASADAGTEIVIEALANDAVTLEDGTDAPLLGTYETARFTFSVESPTPHGTVTVKGTSLVYTSAADYGGEDKFTYHVLVNGKAAPSGSAVVRITVAAPAPTPTPTPTPTPKPKPKVKVSTEPSVYYSNCDAVRAAGAAPVRRGDPGYAAHLDRDNDGVGCEPYGAGSGGGSSSGGSTGGSSTDGGSSGGGDTYYANCSAVRAAGAAPIHRGDPGYGSHLDRDGDGVACE